MSEKVNSRRLLSSSFGNDAMPKEVVSPSKQSDYFDQTTNQGSLLDRSLQLKMTDDRLAKLEKMYQDLCVIENAAKNR